jgi:hypothetical protein
MAKSKKIKPLKKGLNPKTKTKTRTKPKDKRKSVKHSKNYINIDNTGLTKVIYTEGSKSPKQTIFKWDGKYDGKDAIVHMNLDVDGKKTKSNIKLSNDELMKILGANVVDKPIDQRLESFDENVSNIFSPYPAQQLEHFSAQPYPAQPLPMMILSQEPQMVMPPPSSRLPVFIDEMPEEQQQIMIISPPPSSKKSKSKSKSKGS